MTDATVNPTSAAPPAPAAPASRRLRVTNLAGRRLLAAWVISILAHTFLFTVMVLVAFPYVSRSPSDEADMTAQIVGEVDAKGPFDTHRPDLNDMTASANPLASHQAPVTRDLPELGGMESPDLSVIGIGTGGADLDKYGLSAGVGVGPDFFGLGGTARGVRSVIYVVDRSGSMMDSFLGVREELKRSVSRLRRSQKFHVIFFSDGAFSENPPAKLVSAIKAHKDEFFEYLDRVMPGGTTVPGPAMRRALSLEPDVIYFLTDGLFDEKLITQLREWNASEKTRIFTIAYLDPIGAERLERIALEHNGEYRYVSVEELRGKG